MILFPDARFSRRRKTRGRVDRMTTTPSWDLHGAKAPSFFPRSILVEAKTIPQGPLVTSSTGKRKVPILVFECGCSLLHSMRALLRYHPRYLIQDYGARSSLTSYYWILMEELRCVGVSTVVGQTDADASPDSNTADLSSIPGRRPTSPTGHHFIFSKSQFVPYLGKPRIPREITEVLSLSVALMQFRAIFSNFWFCFCFVLGL